VNLGEAHANYAQVLLAQGRTDEAIAVFRRALEANPADAPARNALGLALETTGDVAAAGEEYRRAMTAAPRLRAARFNYGRTLVASGRLREAIAEFEKLRTPEDIETPRYLFALAAARVRLGEVERGRAEAQAALELAKQYGLSELAAEIERDLARLK
jgi:Flp pilus assembly protein TadD